MDPLEPADRRRRVCLLSGGGDAPGVNAMIRGFVHAAHRLSLDVVGCHYGFEGLLGPRGLRALVNPFFVDVGDGTTRDMGPSIVERLRARAIDGLVLIGGDGTMIAAEHFAALGLPTLGIPKTIDNDLAGTDWTCGFDTAVGNATRAIDALHSTAEAHARVMIVELMGRHTGAIAIHAGVAGGADVVLIPEIPYRMERIIAKIRERESLGLRFSIIVIAEGATSTNGELPMVEAGRPGHLPRLGGAGALLLRELERADLRHEIRLTVLGHLLRGGTPSATDRTLGTMVGTFAAQLCRDGAFGQRVVVRDGAVLAIPLAKEDQLHKRVDVDGPMVRAARLVGIELGG